MGGMFIDVANPGRQGDHPSMSRRFLILPTKRIYMVATLSSDTEQHPSAMKNFYSFLFFILRHESGGVITLTKYRTFLKYILQEIIPLYEE